MENIAVIIQVANYDGERCLRFLLAYAGCQLSNKIPSSRKICRYMRLGNNYHIRVQL